MATIPRIVLDDRAVDTSDPEFDPPSSITPLTTPHHPPPSSSSFTTTTSSTLNGPMLVMSGGGHIGGRPLSGVELPMTTEHTDYVPHRCNSDIGLPTTSMPDLPYAMGGGRGGGEHGEGVDKLGVYCSPRTTRRSVDFEVGSSRGSSAARADYEWLEDKPSSLQVLNSGSRVGSAVSLNSVCTAHSVGLLSNDSSDEYQDSFLQEVNVLGYSASLSDRTGSHLRRLQSTPETEVVTTGGSGIVGGSGSDSSNISPRTSHSLCNLNAVQNPATLSSSASSKKDAVFNKEQLTPEKLCLLPSELDECNNKDSTMQTSEDGRGKRKQEEEIVRIEGEKTKVGPMEVCEPDGSSSPIAMVSYGKGSTTMRDGRIRRWLQDMDKATD